MSKYKVGDKVTVREDLDTGHHGVIDSMLKYKGEEVTIERIYPNGEYIEYRFEEIGYTWTDECIVGLTEDIKPVFKAGDKVEIISLTDWDYTNVSIGDKGTVYSIHNKEDLGCFVNMENNRTVYMYYNQIKLVEESKEKYVKCIDNKGNAFNVLELNKTYQVINEDLIYYELKDNATFWNKLRFEEIPNPQNPVKSSVSEPLKSNKMELLMPVLDIIERLQELEIDKDNVEEIISRIESDEKIESSSRWYELKIQELEYENSKLQKENVDLYSYITKISEMTRTCIIDRL